MRYKPIEKPRKVNIQLRPWHYVVISIILVLGAFLIGATLGTKIDLKVQKSATESSENTQLDIVYNYLEEVRVAIANHDIHTLESSMKGSEFDLEKSDYKAIVEYFNDKDVLLNQFIAQLKSQGDVYLNGHPKENTFFYLDDIDGKIGIKVNKANVEIIPRTRIEDIVTEVEGGDRVNHNNKEDKNILIEGILPVTTKIKVEAGEWSEEHEYDFIKAFIKPTKMNGYDTTLRTLAFKHGAGISVNVVTNVDEAKLYINGKISDIKIGTTSYRVDALKEGDTLRAEYQGERSKEYKVRKENEMAELDFEIAKEEERFGVSKSAVDSGEVIAKNLLNTITNGVSSKDASVLKNVVDSGIESQAHDVVNNLINKYNSLIFSDVKATNATMSGTRLDMTLEYSYECADSFGSSIIQQGDMSIAIDLSTAKVLSFNLN